MPAGVEVGFLEKVRPQINSLVNEDARRLPGLRYCDVRIQVKEEKGAVAENGNEKMSAEDYAFDFGVRVIAGGKVAAPGYYGKVLGSTDTDRIGEVVLEGIRQAHQRARANARMKGMARRRFGALGESLYDTHLAPVAVGRDTVPATYRVDPRSVPLEDAVRMAVDSCKAAQGVSNQIVYAAASASTFIMRELFCSSEGADLDQSFAQTEGFVIVICSSEHGNMEIYDFTGHQRGWDILTEGYDNGTIVLPSFTDFCRKLATDGVEVANSPPLRPPDKDVVVVTDPHFNTLLVHEVVGHPSELDRALKYETSYAGRSWFLKDIGDNQMGRQIASSLVNAFSDPTMEGFGSFKYDHDGTPARRAYHIRNGTFEEFLNNRQTAAIMEVEPNGSSRATEANLIPLIRMTNTVFAPGDRDPQEIMGEVEDGYYVSGHRIPSVSEARENFRITAVKVYEIKNGQLGQLYRDGGITSDSRDYFMSIDAVGSDFRMYPIPNCGKGQPMQAKRMSNGGPTMRGVARLTGVVKVRGTFYYPNDIGDPQGERYQTLETLVDTGASFTVLPGMVLQGTGVTFHTRELFTLAYGWQVESDVVQTWVRIDGRSVLTPAVFGEEGEGALLGAYTLEGLGVGVDPTNRRLMPTPRLLMSICGKGQPM